MADRSILVRLRAEISDFQGKFASAGKAAGDLAGRVDKASASVTNVGDKAAKGGLVLTAALVGMGKAAIDWESAWAGVTKTVDGTTGQLSALEGELRNMARTLPASHKEIAAVAEAAGQLGVKTEDVAKFTKTMIDLGETTNLTADEAATSLAQFMNVMGTSADDVERLGSTIVDLGNKGASTERDIVQMGQRIAAAGKSIGLSETEVLGFASALASVGVEAEAGGSAISMSFKQIDKAARQGGEALDVIAKTAGMSSSAFQKAWGEDAAGATTAFIEGLGRVQKSGGDANAILDTLGMTGIRQSDSLLRLASAGGLLADNLSNGASAWTENSALAAEAGKRYATTESQIKIAWNNIKDAAIEGGAVLLPLVADLAKGASGMASAFAGLPDPVKRTGVGMIAAGAGALLAVGGFSKLLTTGLELRTSLKDLAAVSPKTAGVVGKLGKVAGVAAGAMVALAAVQWVGSTYQAGVDATRMSIEDLITVASRAGAGAGFGAIDEQLSNIAGHSTDLGAALRALSVEGSGAERFFVGLSETVTGTKTTLTQTRETVANLDEALARMDSKQAAAAFEAIAKQGRELGLTTEQLADLFPQYAARLQESARAAGEAKTGAEALAGAQDVLAADTRSATDALRDQANLLLAQSGSMIGLEAAIDAATDSLKENGKTLDITTEKGRANQSALNDIASSALSVRDAQKQAGASTAEMDATTVKARASFIAAAISMGMSAQKAGELATQYGLIPSDVVTEISTPGATISKQQAADLNAQIAKIPPEKRANIITIANTQGAAAAQRAIDEVNSKTVTLTVRQVWVQVGGPVKASAGADGGIFSGTPFGMTQSFAGGGFPRFVGSIGSRTNGIYPYAGEAGVIMNEKDSGPWEGIVSGHPRKRKRSRLVASEIVHRLGGDVAWQMADGGVLQGGRVGSRAGAAIDPLAIRAALDGMRVDIDNGRLFFDREMSRHGRTTARRERARTGVTGA